MKYVYRCTSCGIYIDVSRDQKENDTVAAPHMFGEQPDYIVENGSLCDGEFKRVWSLSGVIFSGDGFYSTDNR